MRARHLFVAVLLLASVGVALSTGAFAPGADQVGDVVLEPTSPYASIENTSAGPQIELAFGDADTGVSADAVSTFDGVFEIHNRGNESAAVYIENAPAGLSFRSGGAPLTETNTRTVGPNGSIPVSVVVDTTGAVVDEGDFSVVADPADPETDSPQVTITDPGNGTLEVSVGGATEDREAVSLTGLAVPDTDAGVTRLAVDTTGPTKLSVAPVSPDDASVGVGPETALLAGVDVNTNRSVEDARVVFTVDATALAESEPVGFHETDTGWERADTTVLSETDDTATVAVTVPGFSRVVLGATPDTADPSGDPSGGDADDAPADEPGDTATSPEDPAETELAAEPTTDAPTGDSTEATLEAPAPASETGGLPSGPAVLVPAFAVLSLLVLARRHLG